jgi:hypothetical protein
MAAGDGIGYVVIGYIASVVLVWVGVSSYKLKRLIEDIPTSKVRSIAMGLVELYGGVAPSKEGVVTAPLSGKDCVHYSYTVQEYRQQGKNSRWVTIKSGAKSLHFFLKDDTGQVLVDLKGANIDVPNTFQLESGTFKDPPAVIQKFLKSEGIAFEGWLGINKKMKYTESAIAPKDKLYVIGTAGDNPFIKAAAKNEENIMIQKGDNKFYYISNKAEKDVLSSMAFKAYGGMIVGGLIFVICLTVTLAAMGLFG